jgi:CheY-like chemotaxis protein
MQQVMWNLLSNAIKFTEKGGHVHVAIQRQADSAQLVVQDDGMGIEPEFLPHVFERFRQADSTTTRSHRGLGLGLAIVRHITEMHGGRVFAESSGKGLGAKFLVEVPLLAGEAGIPTSLPSPPALESPPLPVGARLGREEAHGAVTLDGIGILVVEDDECTAEAVVRLLRQAGASVRMADSVPAAMALLREWRPNVVLSDIGLPFEDGYSLLRKLRSLSGSEEDRIPAIAMTAYAHAEERARLLAEGFDAHLAKPVDSAMLLRTLARYRSFREGISRGAPGAALSASRSL